MLIGAAAVRSATRRAAPANCISNTGQLAQPRCSSAARSSVRSAIAHGPLRGRDGQEAVTRATGPRVRAQSGRAGRTGGGAPGTPTTTVEYIGDTPVRIRTVR